MNRQSNTSSLGSVYSEQSGLHSPVLKSGFSTTTSYEDEAGNRGVEDDTKPAHQFRTILINPVGYMTRDERRKNSNTASSLGTISSNEGLLPPLEMQDDANTNTDGYSEASPMISVKSILALPLTPPQRSPLRLKPTIVLPSIITSPSTSTSSTSSSSLAPSPTFPFNSSQASTPTQLQNLPNLPIAGPGYDLISLEEARRRVALARNLNSPNSPDSSKSINSEGRTTPPSATSTTSPTTIGGVKGKKSGFFRRMVSDDSSSFTSIQNGDSNASGSNIKTKERSISAPITASVVHTATLAASPKSNSSFKISPINTTPKQQFPPTKDTPLPSPTSAATPTTSTSTTSTSTTTISTSNSFKSKTMSFFSSSTSSQSLNSIPTPHPLPPSLSLRRISETFATSIPLDYLVKENIKIEPPTDTTIPSPRIEVPKTEDLFGRWSVFDSVDDSVLLGLTKVQMRVQPSNHLSIEPAKGISSRSSSSSPTSENGEKDSFGFMEFTSTKGLVDSNSNESKKGFENSRATLNGRFIKVIDHQHCSNDEFDSTNSSASNPSGMISRGRFKGSGGRGAIFGSKLVKESFKMQQ